MVFVLHGIRDMGAWTSEFMHPLQSGFAALHPGTDEKIYVHRAAYGYFSMGSFLLFGDRQKNVRWFMDQVTELRARFPNLKEIHFIGHSNGTEVLTTALATYRTFKVGRVVFAGSVVRRDFEWSRFVGRVGQVRNYVGSADWVVALFPKLFELRGFRFLNPDLGSAGYNGFEDGFVKGDPVHCRRTQGCARFAEHPIRRGLHPEGRAGGCGRTHRPEAPTLARIRLAPLLGGVARIVCHRRLGGLETSVLGGRSLGAGRRGPQGIHSVRFPGCPAPRSPG